MVIQNNLGLCSSSSAFEVAISRATANSGLNLQQLKLEFVPEKKGWEWIGFVAPHLSHWVSIVWEENSWTLSAITDQCGVLKIVHCDLNAALTELKLVMMAQPLI